MKDGGRMTFLPDLTSYELTAMVKCTHLSAAKVLKYLFEFQKNI